jgi:hypothetical protein
VGQPEMFLPGPKSSSEGDSSICRIRTRQKSRMPSNISRVRRIGSFVCKSPITDQTR